MDTRNHLDYNIYTKEVRRIGKQINVVQNPKNIYYFAKSILDSGLDIRKQNIS